MTQTTSSAEIQAASYRRMTLEDVPRVREIDLLSFSLPWPEKSFRFELAENPTTLALVAELSSSNTAPLVIGMSVTWIIIDEAHIATIAVHPDYRSHGFGKQLLTETLSRSAALGAHLATLEVRASNLIAQQMYHAFGFTIMGRRIRYYRDNDEDAIIMTLPNIRATLTKLAR